MKELMRKYLDAQAKKDAALKAAYKPELLDKCAGYITSEARKKLGGKSGCVADAVVYKILPMEELAGVYGTSCPLKFSDTWDFKTVVPQFCTGTLTIEAGDKIRTIAA